MSPSTTAGRRGRPARPTAGTRAAAAAAVALVAAAAAQTVTLDRVLGHDADEPAPTPTTPAAAPEATPASAAGQVESAGSADLEPEPDGPDAPAAADAEPFEPNLVDEVRLVLRTGEVLTAELIEEREITVRVRVLGVPKTIARADIVTYERLPGVLERFRERRAEVGDEDVNARLLLVEWLRGKRAYRTAHREAEELAEISPFDRRVRQQVVWLRNQVALLADSPEDAAGRATDASRPAAARPRPASRSARFPLLTPDEVNLIRVYELDLADPPPLILPRRAVESFVEAYADHELMPPTPEAREALLFASETRVVDLMFQTRARDFYGEVRVDGDPAAMRRFREDVHGSWLLNACASAACHGGQEAGRLWLSTRRRNSERVVYTNFLILERFRLDDGTPLINYDEPAASPLLTMALPRELASTPHPVVSARAGRRGWSAQFRSETDPGFRRAMAWIDAMYRPRPEYPIDYTPPVPRAAREQAERDAQNRGPVER